MSLHIMTKTAALLTFVLVLAGMTSCASLQKAFSEEGVIFKQSAVDNYTAGEEAFSDHNWEEAIKYYQHTKSKFPYSKYAVLASLRSADALFESEKYLEAVESYRSFLKLHPKNEKKSYAVFMVAKCYYKRMPEDWFFLPPVREKEQTAALDAQNTLGDFIARYPKDERVTEAQELLSEVRKRLVEHERYAMDFYSRKQQWRGVAWRAQRIADQFPQTTESATALLRAGEAYEKLGEGKAALRMYERLIKEQPQSPEALEAQARIGKGIEHLDVDEKSPQAEQATVAPKKN